MRYHWRRTIGILLSIVPLHSWTTATDSPSTRRRKSRSLLSTALIPLGNLYLRLQGSMVEVLSTRAWLARELAVAAILGRNTTQGPGKNTLELDVIPGRTLGQILQSDIPIDHKLLALRLAAAGMRSLHSCRIAPPTGKSLELSHGDATCHNVIVDLERNAAAWIDFDTTHRAGLACVERLADDVRALLFSSIVCAPPAIHDLCVRTVLDGYDHAPIVSQLQSALRAQACPTVMELAQAPLDFTTYRQLRESILQFSA